MSKTIRILFVIVLVSLFLTATVFTAGARGGDCPPGFMLHIDHEHPEDHTGHMHKHVGTSADQNGDGDICVKHATPTEKIHVHIDDAVK